MFFSPKVAFPDLSHIVLYLHRHVLLVPGKYMAVGKTVVGIHFSGSLGLTWRRKYLARS
jgi:hypothetical protein